jgi:hypothetical protein
MSDHHDAAILAERPRKISGTPPSTPLERTDFANMIASHLREMSEHAYRAGFGNSSSLIEVAALMIEMEGRTVGGKSA